jgi:hypothetical protein
MSGMGRIASSSRQRQALAAARLHRLIGVRRHAAGVPGEKVTDTSFVL